MDFGTALHETLELFKCREPEEWTKNLDWVVQLFKDKFNYLFWKQVLLYDEDEQARFWLPEEEKRALRPEQFLLAGERILRRLDECEELRTCKVLFNEYKLEEPMDRSDGLDIKFKGYVDMVILTKAKNGKKVIYICDFKGAPWGWSYEKKQDKELHFQILLYKHFFCKKHGLDPKEVRTAFVLLLRTPRPEKKGSSRTVTPVEFFEISAGPVSVQRAVDELNRDVTQLKQRFDSGTLVKNHKQCVDPKWGDRCPYLGTEHCDAPEPPRTNA